MRDRSDHATPDERRHRLRFVQGTVLPHEPQDRAGKAILGRRAIAVREPGQGSHLPVPACVADGDLAARPAYDLLRVPVRAPYAGRGGDLGEDLARPDGERPKVPGPVSYTHLTLPTSDLV